MKLLIFQKLFSKNKLRTFSVLSSIGIWIVLQVPIVIFFLYLAKVHNEKLNGEILQAQEISLANTFQNLSRFGDLVNSRKQILEIGRPVGLENFEICKDGKLYIPHPFTDQCPNKPSQIVKVGDENIDLVFGWKKKSSGEDLPYLSIIFPSVTSLVLILLFLFILYLIFKTKVNTLSIKISELVDNPLALDEMGEFPELNPVISTIKKLVHKQSQNALSQNENIKVDIAKRVAHDIRAPLSALNIVVSTATNLPLEQTNLLRNSIERINRIALDLLADEKQKKTGLKKPFDIVKALNEIIEEKNQKYSVQKDIRLQFSSTIQSMELRNIQKEELQRILSNLIENSIEAKKSELLIQVRILTEPNFVRIEVEDNGSGISEENLLKIGKKGFSTKSKGDSGYGIGIHSAFETITNWKGTIKFFSELNRGTLVEIQLPLK